VSATAYNSHRWDAGALAYDAQELASDDDRWEIQLDAPSAPSVSVIIVTTSYADGLVECLQSLAEAAEDTPAFETIVVLNGADDGFRRLLRDRVRGVIVVDLEVNRGFAGGCAAGRPAASGEYLALLHDDAVAAPDWLEALVACAGEHRNAAVTGRIVFGDGRLQSSGCILWRDGATTQIGYGEPDEPERHDRRRVVDYGSSSSLLVRTEAWDAAGGPDQTLYPAYYVDLDLAMALRRLGTTVMYEPGARTIHHQGTTASLAFRDVAVARNRARFLHKWGDQLADQEVAPERGDAEATARAVARALARCEARARASTPLGHVGSPTAPPELLSNEAFILMQQELEALSVFPEQLRAERAERQRLEKLAHQLGQRRSVKAVLTRLTGPFR